MAGAAQARAQTAGHLLFKAGQAGHASGGAELSHAAHHDHGAAGQHNVVLAHVQQVGDQAVVSLLAGVGCGVDVAAPGHKAVHAVGRVAEAHEQVGAHARAAELLAEQQQRRGADAAADHGNALVLPGQCGSVKAVAAGAGHGQRVVLFQRGQLVGALAFDLIQEGQCAGLVVKVVNADGAGKNRRGVRGPGAQHVKLPGVGLTAAVLPLDRKAHNILCDGFLTQDRQITACCIHPEYPPAYARTRCRQPRQRQRRAASCKPAGCRGWS